MVSQPPSVKEVDEAVHTLAEDWKHGEDEDGGVKFVANEPGAQFIRERGQIKESKLTIGHNIEGLLL